MLNTKFHHVDLSWIIYSTNQMKYDIKENNHLDWLNKVPWYNTAICSELNGTVFGYFIRNARTDRYNILRSVTTHDKK